MTSTSTRSPHLHRYVPPTLPDVSGLRWGPAAASHGGEFVWPGRAVLALPGRVWPHRPETCPVTQDNEWVLEGTVLVCRGCGLDST